MKEFLIILNLSALILNALLLITFGFDILLIIGGLAATGGLATSLGIPE